MPLGIGGDRGLGVRGEALLKQVLRNTKRWRRGLNILRRIFMKKLLVILLAAVMVLGFGSAAFAASYSDIGDLPQGNQDAIEKLSALKVVEGYLDGTFGPAQEITRAEFAKITCNLAGIGDAAGSLGTLGSRFSDVGANIWYTGWVNLAAAQGYVNGYPDGSFKPNNKITQQEVITVLLRILGYDDNLPGPWPFDYISQAVKLNLTSKVTFVATSNAISGDVAYIASELLSETMVFWDSAIGQFSDIINDNTKIKQTLLLKSFASRVVHDARLDSWEVTNFAKKTIALSYDSFVSRPFAENFYITKGISFNNLGGHIGDIYLATNPSTDREEIIFVDVTSRTENHDLVTVERADYFNFAYIQNVSIDGKRVSGIGAAPNDVEINASLAALGVGTHADLETRFYYDKDDNIYRINRLSTNQAAIVVDSYGSNRISTLVGTGFSTSNKDVVVIKGGKWAALEDLATGDVFFRSQNGNGVDEVISVSSFSEGELTKGSATKLTIGESSLLWANATYTDDDYDNINTINDVTDVEDGFGTTVKYITANGNPYRLAFLNFTPVDNTTRLYGIVTDATGNIAGGINSLTVFNQTGEKVTYSIVKGDDPRPVWGTSIGYGSYIEAKVGEDNTIDTDDILLLTKGSEGINSVAANNFTTAGTLYGNDDIDTNDSKKYIVHVHSTLGDQLKNAIDSKRLYIGGTGNGDPSAGGGKYYTIDDNTVILNVVRNNTTNTFDKAELLTASELTAAKELENRALIAKISDGHITAIAILDSSASSSSTYGVLRNARYDGKYRIDVLGGESYEIANTTFSAFSGRGGNDKTFTGYRIVGGKLTYTNGFVNATSGVATGTLTDDREWVQPNGGHDNTPGTLVSVATKSGNVLRLGTDSINYTVASDAKIYLREDSNKLVESALSDVLKNSQIFALTTDSPEDLILDYIIIINQNPPAVIQKIATFTPLDFVVPVSGTAYAAHTVDSTANHYTTAITVNGYAAGANADKWDTGDVPAFAVTLSAGSGYEFNTTLYNNTYFNDKTSSIYGTDIPATVAAVRVDPDEILLTLTYDAVPTLITTGSVTAIPAVSGLSDNDSLIQPSNPDSTANHYTTAVVLSGAEGGIHGDGVWDTGEVPKLTVTLTADTGYDFDLTSFSDIYLTTEGSSLYGATPTDATIKIPSTRKVIVVELTYAAV
jgi:hypothetical protein